MVDAVSILSLGRVFVANMTGNVVFPAPRRRRDDCHRPRGGAIQRS
jgi:hypothetical protein